MVKLPISLQEVYLGKFSVLKEWMCVHLAAADHLMLNIIKL